MAKKLNAANAILEERLAIFCRSYGFKKAESALDAGGLAINYGTSGVSVVRMGDSGSIRCPFGEKVRSREELGSTLLFASAAREEEARLFRSQRDGGLDESDCLDETEDRAYSYGRGG
jgi:hypothetical protein